MIDKSMTMLFTQLATKAEFLARAHRPGVVYTNNWTIPEMITECQMLLAEIKEKHDNNCRGR